MKRNQLACLFAAITFAVCSCKKENYTNHVTGQQVYLTKVVSFGADTSTLPFSIENYHCDGLDRLQSIVTTRLGYTPTGSVFFLDPDSLIYYYNAADTLPFKALHYNYGTFTPAEYYTYDSQARVIHKVWVDAASGELYYTYLPNQITVNGTIGYIYTLAYNGNNVTENISIPTNTSFPPVFRDTVHTQFSNLLNPFNLVSINRHVPDIPVYSNNQEFVFNKNAPLQITDIRQGVTVDYQYENIVNGLPGKATVIYNSRISARIYFYYSQ